MSADRGFPPFTLREGRLHVVPVCHYRFEFAHAVRRAVLSMRPSLVLVELPPMLGEPFRRAVERFPRLSVVFYETEEGEAMLLPVEPSDPFAEAVRTSREAGIEVRFVDLNVRRYPLLFDPMPDPYAVHVLGLERYWSEYARTAGERPRTAMDRQREMHMAAEVALALDEVPGEVMLVCGMAHVAPVLEAVRTGAGERGQQSPVSRVGVYNPRPDSVREIAAEMPMLITVYERLRGGPGPEETWVSPVVDDVSGAIDEGPGLEEMDRQDVMRSIEALLGMARDRGQLPPDFVLTPELMRALSRKLGGFRDPRLVFSMDDASQGPPALEGAPRATPWTHRIFKFRSCNERREDLRHFYDACAARRRAGDGALDRQRLCIRLIEQAVTFYRDNTGEAFHHWQLRTLVRFGRSYARLTGRLLPDFFQWIVAARGVSDDNYAYEVWDLGSFYPWQRDDDEPGVTSIDIHADEVWLGEQKITFRRRYPRFRERMTSLPVRKRRHETEPGEWSKEFNKGSICSYPPEDVVIEDYGIYLKKKALLVLSEERTRTEPFTTSMLDGLDMRETIRNWTDQHRIFVREVQKVSGGAGSVVMIFDEDLEDRRFPWKMTWHGEHEQESDMAFYATPMGSKIVGPGIARCEYGGLLLTYPPRRMMDVWTDPFYAEAQTKAEVLLHAALEYSKEKHVVYVAAKPPRSIFRQLAGRLGRKIVYLPMGQLSPVSVKKIRVFHVLSGHHLREIAKDYIW